MATKSICGHNPPRIVGHMAEARTELLKVRLTPSEMAVLDQARGETSRSEFARQLILDPAKAVRYEKATPPRPGRSTRPAGSHLFKSQTGNALRCEHCGVPKGRHP